MRKVLLEANVRLHEPRWMLAKNLQMRQLIKDGEGLVDSLNTVVFPREFGRVMGIEREGKVVKTSFVAGMIIVRGALA